MMYSILWRNLRGTFIQKVLQLALLAGIALALMYFFVFPWLDAVVFPETETQI